jgi:phage baseplate assembly protein W
MTDQDEILGAGWEFPPRFDKGSNSNAMLAGQNKVENSIYVIIHTKIGERILRNEFGSTIYELVFEALNENMKTYMSDALKRSLENNEPRINVLKVDLIQEDPSLGRVDISIQYRLIETNETKNLVVPFYTPENLSIS